MKNFIFFTILFLIAGGLILHFNLKIFLVTEWIGKLPGDFVIKKGKITIFFPIVSAAILSFIVSFILSLFKKKKS